MQNRQKFQLNDTWLGWSYLNGYFVKGVIDIGKIAYQVTPAQLATKVLMHTAMPVAQYTKSDGVISTTQVGVELASFYLNPIAWVARYATNYACDVVLDDQWNRLSEEQRRENTWKEFFAALHIVKLETASKVGSFAEDYANQMKNKKDPLVDEINKSKDKEQQETAEADKKAKETADLNQAAQDKQNEAAKLNNAAEQKQQALNAAAATKKSSDANIAQQVEGLIKNGYKAYLPNTHRKPLTAAEAARHAQNGVQVKFRKTHKDGYTRIKIQSPAAANANKNYAQSKAAADTAKTAANNANAEANRLKAAANDASYDEFDARKQAQNQHKKVVDLENQQKGNQISSRANRFYSWFVSAIGYRGHEEERNDAAQPENPAPAAPEMPPVPDNNEPVQPPAPPAVNMAAPENNPPQMINAELDSDEEPAIDASSIGEIESSVAEIEIIHEEAPEEVEMPLDAEEPVDEEAQREAALQQRYRELIVAINAHTINSQRVQHGLFAGDHPRIVRELQAIIHRIETQQYSLIQGLQQVVQTANALGANHPIMIAANRCLGRIDNREHLVRP